MTSRPYHGVTLWAVPRFRRLEQPSAGRLDQLVSAGSVALSSRASRLEADPALPEGNVDSHTQPAAQ